MRSDETCFYSDTKLIDTLETKKWKSLTVAYRCFPHFPDGFDSGISDIDFISICNELIKFLLNLCK